MRALVALAYLSSASALQLPQQASASIQRRGFLAGVAVMIPGAALAEGTPDTTALNRQLHSSGVNPFNRSSLAITDPLNKAIESSHFTFSMGATFKAPLSLLG